MKKYFENRTIWFYLSLSTILLNLIVLLFGLISPGFALKSFDVSVIIAIIVCIASVIASVFVPYRFMSVVCALTNGVVLALVAYWGSPIIADLINNINFLNGNSTTVIFQIVLSVIACAIAVVVSFFDTNKEEQNV